MSSTWASDLASGVRLLRRDWRSGELRVLILALTLAVLAVTSVGFLAERAGRALEQNSAQMLGGDLVVRADGPIEGGYVQHAATLGLDVTQTQEFPSMVSSPTATQLAAIKAVVPGYPLRGTLSVSAALAEPGTATHAVPDRGTVWVDGRMLGLLGSGPGDTLTVGDAVMTITRILTYEPDRGVQFVNVAPRLLMRSEDLAATGLVAPGSRIRYKLFVAGASGAVSRYTAWLTPRLDRGESLSTLDSSRPEIKRALERAHQFLVLVALLTVAIAAVAVAMAARRFNLRHQDGIAIMRCMGATKPQLSRMLWTEFLLLAAGSAALGTLIGYGVQHGLVGVLTSWIGMPLPAPSWRPALQGLATGLMLLLGFILPPLIALHRVAPVRVLRRGVSGGSRYGWRAGAVGALAFYVLALWISRDIRLSLAVVGGFMLAFLAFSMFAYGGVRAMGWLRHCVVGYPSLRFALAGIAQRRSLTVAQICALAIGLTILLLLTITRTDLLAGWQNTLPSDTPNTFLINIQPAQRVAVQTRLTQAGIGPVALAPMVRGRLVAINRQPVNAQRYTDERAKRLADREFNLSYVSSLPASNQIAEGRWLNPSNDEVSIETDLAETLGIQVNDQLSFDVAGQAVDVRVSSLREVKWDSFQVNFFALLTAKALKDAPATYITSFFLPGGDTQLARELVHEFPNLTVFDAGSILGQVQHVLDQVIESVQLLFLFTILAGMLVLGSAFFSTRDERMHEVAILRALGAGSRQLSAALRIEFALIGALAGLLAAAAAVALASLLAAQVFDFSLSFSWWPWIAGVAVGALAASAAGLIALKGVLKTPPLVSLREVA